MTLISKLEDYYGMASEFIRTEILKRTGSFTDDVLEDVYQKIINIHPIKRGFPDMTVFNKVLQEARLTKEPHVYYWNIFIRIKFTQRITYHLIRKLNTTITIYFN